MTSIFLHPPASPCPSLCFRLPPSYCHIDPGDAQVRGEDHRVAQRDRRAEQEDGGGEGRRHQGGERVRRVTGFEDQQQQSTFE